MSVTGINKKKFTIRISLDNEVITEYTTLAEMNKLQKGFTLIELIISITLLSLITIITTSILQNSIIQEIYT